MRPASASVPMVGAADVDPRLARDRARYTRTAVVLHWVIGLALLGEIAFGFYLRVVPRLTPLRGPLTNVHKAVGIVLGVAILLRLAWRIAHRPPPLPASVPDWQARAAHVNHALMYACMVLIPVSGYIASNFSRFGIKWFGTMVLPPWGPDRPEVYAFFNGLHDATAWLLLVLVSLHVIATLKHALVDRDRPFARLSLRRP